MCAIKEEGRFDRKKFRKNVKLRGEINPNKIFLEVL